MEEATQCPDNKEVPGLCQLLQEIHQGLLQDSKTLV